MARTLADLAAEVLHLQDACNLSGVVHSWSRSITILRVLLGEQHKNKFSTDLLNQHPINVLFADKVAHLTGGGSMCHGAAVESAWDECRKLAEGRPNPDGARPDNALPSG